MNRCQGFPLHDATIWVEDLGSKQYRVWYSHNGAPHKHFNECTTRDPVRAVQENRGLILAIYARHAARNTPALMRAARVETYTAWAEVLLMLMPVVGGLLCFTFLGPVATVAVVLVVLCLRRA